jgi:DNA-binding LacI/PurR family transcriptional regulator
MVAPPFDSLLRSDRNAGVKSGDRQPVRPTMAKVAELAGVSKITVSRALAGSSLVRPEVRERVVEVARAAGYRMNVAARNLRTQRNRTVAVVVEKLIDGDRPIADPILLLLLGGLLEVLTPSDHAMLVTTLDHFLGSSGLPADGIIMIGQGREGGRVAEIAAYGLPMVTWGASGRHDPAIIGSDNRMGGCLAADHLVEIGRRRILFLGDAAHPEVASRLAGVRERVAASEAMLVSVVRCDFSRGAGAAAIERELAAGTRFDAVIAVSDYIAAGVCDALLARGTAIPREVAVMGFDDISVAANHRPPLSSIRQDWHAAGRTLAQALLAQLEGGERPASTTLPVELVVRQSTAA